MAHYHYKDSPLIERVDFQLPHTNVAQAMIIAKKEVTAEQLEELRKKLGSQSFSTMMDTVDGVPAIQVRGLRDEKSLLGALGKLGLVHGPVEKELTEDDKKQVSFRDKVRGKAFFLSSIFYDLGNVAFIMSGIMRGRHNPDGKMMPHDKSEMLIGAAFGVGDALMTAVGGLKGDEELNVAANGLKKHLYRKGITIPEGDALNPDTLHQSGVLKATHRWLHSHIVQVKCMSEMVGGLFTMHAALKPGNHNHGKLAAGLLISTGWLATLLLTKPRGQSVFNGAQPDSPTFLQAAANNPRGLIARPLAIGNNIANLWGSLNPYDGERTRFHNELSQAQTAMRFNNTAETRAQFAYAQNKQHDYMWNVISACSFMVAHALFGLSGSKRPQDTEDDKRVMQDMVLLSANVLAKQPQAVSDVAIGEAADYVSKLAHIHATKTQLEEAIREKITALSQSSWVARVQSAPGTGLQPAV